MPSSDERRLAKLEKLILRVQQSQIDQKPYATERGVILNANEVEWYREGLEKGLRMAKGVDLE